MDNFMYYLPCSAIGSLTNCNSFPTNIFIQEKCVGLW